MDGRLRIAEAASAAPAPDGHDLGKDRERGLLDRLTAEIQPCGTAEPRDVQVRQAFLAETLAPLRLRSARAERADVERVAPKRPGQRGDVDLLVVREDEDGGVLICSRARESVFGPAVE